MEQTHKIKLLTVEDAFLIEGRGVLVTPQIPVDAYSGPRSPLISLRKPDGQESTATAWLDIPRVNPQPKAFYYLCMIAGVTKDDVPIGTEIWINEHAV